MKKDTEEMARQLFNPYAKKLKFNEKNWEAFLNKLCKIDQAAKEEIITTLIRWCMVNYHYDIHEDSRKFQVNYKKVVHLVDIINYCESLLQELK